MRFNVGVWDPRDRQREKGKAFLEPKMIARRKSLAAGDKKRSRTGMILAIKIMIAGEGILNRAIKIVIRIVQDQDGFARARIGGENTRLRKKASRDTAEIA